MREFFKKNKVGVTLISAVVLVVALSVWYAFPTHAPDRVLSLRLTTVPIATLPQHEHTEGEAEFDPGHAVYAYSSVVTVPEDMWVTSITDDFLGAPPAVLHHLIVKELGVADDSCPDRTDRTLLLLGRDTPQPIHFPAPYGQFIPKGTRLELIVMLHNPEPPEGPGGTYHNVAVTIDFTGVATGGSRTRNLESRFLALSDYDFCKDDPQENTFTVPASAEGFVEKPMTINGVDRGRITFPTNAIIVGQGAHLHAWDGGVELDTYLNEKHLGSYPSKRANVQPWSWITRDDTHALLVRAGDTFSITATYNNPDPVPLRGAMGMLGIYYWQWTSPLDWFTNAAPMVHVPSTGIKNSTVPNASF